VKTYYLILLFIISTCKIVTQNPEWINYSYPEGASAIAFEGDIIWIGSGSLIKLNRNNGECTIYNYDNTGLLFYGIRSITIDGSGNKWIATGDLEGYVVV
jgi:hypothetical protein